MVTSHRPAWCCDHLGHRPTAQLKTASRTADCTSLQGPGHQPGGPRPAQPGSAATAGPGQRGGGGGEGQGGHRARLHAPAKVPGVTSEACCVCRGAAFSPIGKTLVDNLGVDPYAAINSSQLTGYSGGVCCAACRMSASPCRASWVQAINLLAETDQRTCYALLCQVRALVRSQVGGCRERHTTRCCSAEWLSSACLHNDAPSPQGNGLRGMGTAPDLMHEGQKYNRISGLATIPLCNCRTCKAFSPSSTPRPSGMLA